ncbi:MlaA family lipoprotein, partial [Parvibaculum sp.]|uniref:MlaA family lipoprotein n=1 Tax=Parvibaculum sp. TaxID=2024848 RepID=UPI0038B23BEB
MKTRDRTGIRHIAMQAILTLALLFGLTSAPHAAMAADEPAAQATADNGADENDPLEPMNRYFFELNKFFDTILLKPVATWYDGVVPEPGRDGVRNFLDNLRSPVILANDLLQGEWERAGTTASRFGINTTVGVLGLFDPAADWGMPQH